MTRAAATVRAYGTDWLRFVTWCEARGEPALPAAPDTVARYVNDAARGLKVSTLRRRLAALRATHLAAGCGSPTQAPAVRLALSRAEWRQRGAAASTTPLAVDDLRAMSRGLPDTPAGTRDRALLLLGYGAGLRPGELADLGADQVRLVPGGLRVDVERGPVVVPFGSAPELCAVRAWKRWRLAAGDSSDPAFLPVDRHGRVGDRPLGVKAVTRIVRRAARGAGLDPARYRGLSLRRGMVNAATEHGVSDARIMAQTGHRSRRLVQRYMRDH